MSLDVTVSNAEQYLRYKHPARNDMFFHDEPSAHPERDEEITIRRKGYCCLGELCPSYTNCCYSVGYSRTANVYRLVLNILVTGLIQALSIVLCVTSNGFDDDTLSGQAIMYVVVLMQLSATLLWYLRRLYSQTFLMIDVPFFVLLTVHYFVMMSASARVARAAYSFMVDNVIPNASDPDTDVPPPSMQALTGVFLLCTAWISLMILLVIWNLLRAHCTGELSALFTLYDRRIVKQQRHVDLQTMMLNQSTLSSVDRRTPAAQPLVTPPTTADGDSKLSSSSSSSTSQQKKHHHHHHHRRHKSHSRHRSRHRSRSSSCSSPRHHDDDQVLTNRRRNPPYVKPSHSPSRLESVNLTDNDAKTDYV